MVDVLAVVCSALLVAGLALILLGAALEISRSRRAERDEPARPEGVGVLAVEPPTEPTAEAEVDRALRRDVGAGGEETVPCGLCSAQAGRVVLHPPAGAGGHHHVPLPVPRGPRPELLRAARTPTEEFRRIVAASTGLQPAGVGPAESSVHGGQPLLVGGVL